MKKDLILVFGNFNIVHPGHLRLLHFAKSLKGKVKVGLFSDEIAGKDIHIPEALRMSSLEAIDLVDEVFIVNEPVEEVIPEPEPVEEPAVEPQSVLPPGVPPIPEEGLPDGWTMEQWAFYGQKWLDQQKGD